VGSSASLQTRPSPLIYRGLTVQTDRATSFRMLSMSRNKGLKGKFLKKTIKIKEIRNDLIQNLI
jgi:hypothetical protein